jgi:hypothetical protein
MNLNIFGKTQLNGSIIYHLSIRSFKLLIKFKKKLKYAFLILKFRKYAYKI